jgi:hypothetical protein
MPDNMPIECQLVGVTRRQLVFRFFFPKVSKGFPEYFSVPVRKFHEQLEFDGFMMGHTLW